MLVHLANGWMFHAVEISPYVSLIYLPAFLRLLNVLVLGPVKGSLATLLGSLLLSQLFNQELVLSLLNSVCSLSGSLAALLLFRVHFQRAVDLSSLRELLLLAIASCTINPLLYHALWSVFDPQNAGTPMQLLQMVVGDFAGCLIGAFVMKWVVVRLKMRSPSP
jgi:uncharacterized membrane protein YdjX (TVP38/TMEM64 family)